MSLVDILGVREEDYFVQGKPQLHRPRPNPMTQASTIQYEVPEKSSISLRIYDALGRLVTVLTEEKKSAGSKSIVWDRKDSQGNMVSPGIYFCSLLTLGKSLTQKLIIVK